jgi:shikimate dehydrogenase
MLAARVTGKYTLYPIPPEDDEHTQIKSLLNRLRDKDLHGLNVTIPYKQTVMPYLDNLTPVACDIGAVNTIYLHQGQLTGENTDASGFIDDLNRLISGTQRIDRQVHKSALILGAGGSARAVAYALSRAQWQVTIAARRIEQAQSLVADISQVDVLPPSLIPLNPTELSYQSPDLIVNTTPVGMYPNVNASPWPEEIALPPHASVYDLVYNPQETKLVQRARKSGLPATTGLGMLIEQAALSFHRWTGMQVSDQTKCDAHKLAADTMTSI